MYALEISCSLAAHEKLQRRYAPHEQRAMVDQHEVFFLPL
jgi:hypothetical protein